MASKSVRQLSAQLSDLPAARGRAPWPGHEYVKGWGVFGCPSTPVTSWRCVCSRRTTSVPTGPCGIAIRAVAGRSTSTAPGSTPAAPATTARPASTPGMPQRMYYIDDSRATPRRTGSRPSGAPASRLSWPGVRKSGRAAGRVRLVRPDQLLAVVGMFRIEL